MDQSVDPVLKGGGVGGGVQGTGVSVLEDNEENRIQSSQLFTVVLRPKKNFVFPLDFKTMLTKH